MSQNSTSSNNTLDQYFTKPEVAKDCYKFFSDFLLKQGINKDDYSWLEPSAGNGTFFSLLPEDKRIGIDLDPRFEGVVKSDYLKWTPDYNKKYLVIGNPPYGKQNHLSFKFIQKSLIFADYVGFVLTSSYASERSMKSLSKVGAFLNDFLKLPKNSFLEYGEKEYHVDSTFFIFSRKFNQNSKTWQQVDSYITFKYINKIKDKGFENYVGNYDLYCDKTVFPNRKLQFVDDYNKIESSYMVCIKIHKNKEEITKILKETDWNHESIKAANTAIHLNFETIKRVIAKKGFKDETLF